MIDDTDKGIVSERQKARLQQNTSRPRQGDLIKNKEGLFARVGYTWDDSLQTTVFDETGSKGSFYFGEGGFLHYSGSFADEIIPLTHLRPTGRTEKAGAWIFHHNHHTAHNSVNVDVYVPVFEVIDDSGDQ